MKASKAKDIADQNKRKFRHKRKRTWLLDFNQAVDFSSQNGYYWMNIALPPHDVVDDVVKILTKFGYDVERQEKFLKVNWRNGD